jgi:hypothetical protein
MASTYLNAYRLLELVRYDLNEYSTGLMQATDTTGAFQNTHIIQKINQSQSYVWNVLFSQFPELFLKSASLSWSASVATLPSDLYRIRRVENSDSVKIEPINIDGKHVYSDQGSEYLYYRYGNTLRMDANSYSDTGTIWYYQRPRELDQGVTSAGGAASATLATSAKVIADYYNTMKIENITDDSVDTITDYSAARVCTVSNTWAASKYYGIVSDLPEAFHHLIAAKATLLCKSLPTSPIRPSADEIKDFNELLRETMRGYAGTSYSDIPIEAVINDFEPIF